MVESLKERVTFFRNFSRESEEMSEFLKEKGIPFLEIFGGSWDEVQIHEPEGVFPYLARDGGFELFRAKYQNFKKT
ncbi:MAG: hypothetical protein KKB62_03825 [Nanoarchaeota archaeon]|nr:hypothetical protein [Nanoarchaeota archaeon]